MEHRLSPQLRVKDVYALTPELLSGLGVKALLLDLDNTLTPYHVTAPAPALLAWRDALLAAGIQPFIVSNSRSGRAAVFAGKAGLPHIDHAGKPRPDGILRALSHCGVQPREAALAGDQIFTDIWGARRAGVLAILVRPISLKQPFRALRYGVETPFRLSCREKR